MLLSKPRFSFPYLALVRVVMTLSKAIEREWMSFQVAYCMKRHFHFERWRFPWKVYLNSNMLRTLTLLSCLQVDSSVFHFKEETLCWCSISGQMSPLDPHDPQFTGLHFGPCLTHRVVRGLYVQLGGKMYWKASACAKSMSTCGQ
jgi:hypothetical protein